MKYNFEVGSFKNDQAVNCFVRARFVVLCRCICSFRISTIIIEKKLLSKQQLRCCLAMIIIFFVSGVHLFPYLCLDERKPPMSL